MRAKMRINIICNGLCSQSPETQLELGQCLVSLLKNESLLEDIKVHLHIF